MRIRISAWAIRNPTPVAILFVALSIWGVLAYNALPIKHYPNVNFPVVVVSVTQSGAAAPEMGIPTPPKGGGNLQGRHPGRALTSAWRSPRRSSVATWPLLTMIQRRL